MEEENIAGSYEEDGIVFDSFINENNNQETWDEPKKPVSKPQLTQDPAQLWLASYVTKKLNLPEGKFVTGKQGGEKEMRVSELSIPQQISLLEYGTRGTQPEFTEEELSIIDAYRNGDTDTIASYAGLDSGPLADFDYSEDPNEYTEEALLKWKISKDFPDLTEDEMFEEIENIKNSTNYDTKLNGVKKAWSEFAKTENQKKEQETFNGLKGFWEKTENEVRGFLETTDDIHRFEITPQDKQKVYQAIFDIGDDGKSMLTRSLNDPREIAYLTTLAVKMPQIEQYVEKLVEENKKLREQIPQPYARKAQPLPSKTNQRNRNDFEVYDVGPEFI